MPRARASGRESGVETTGNVKDKAPVKRRKRTPKKPPDVMQRIGKRWDNFRNLLVEKGFEPVDIDFHPGTGRIEVTCNVEIPAFGPGKFRVMVAIRAYTLSSFPMDVPVAERAPQPTIGYGSAINSPVEGGPTNVTSR